MEVCGISPDSVNVILVSCYKVTDSRPDNGNESPAHLVSGTQFCNCVNFHDRLCITAEADPSSQRSVQDDSWDHAAEGGPGCRSA